jgi:hypothetical protein
MTNPTFSPQDLKALVIEVMKETMAGKAMPNPFMADAKAGKRDQIEALTIKAFRRAGFGDAVVPRVDVMTYNKWLEAGFKVRTGEKAIKVKQFRLFHKSQVEAVEPAEKPTPKAATPKASKVTPIKPAKGKGDQPALGL